MSRYKLPVLAQGRFRLIQFCINNSLICIHYTVYQKNDTDVVHYNFNTCQPILVIFGRDVAERVCYWMVIWYSTSPK